MILLILSILPVILIGYYYYKKDTRKEPKKLLRNLFLSGILSGVIVIVVSLIGLICFPMFLETDKLNLLGIFIYSFIFVSMIEEFFKWLMIYKISYNHQEYDQMYDIILYAVFVSLGFACFENILYVLSKDGGIWIALFRAITAIPAHACFGTFMGYYLTLSKFENNKKYLYYSILIPIILHGTYDFLLLSGYTILVIVFLIFIVSLFIFTILRIKKIIRLDKDKLNLNNCPNCKIIINENFCPICGYKKKL